MATPVAGAIPAEVTRVVAIRVAATPAVVIRAAVVEDLRGRGNRGRDTESDEKLEQLIRPPVR